MDLSSFDVRNTRTRKFAYIYTAIFTIVLTIAMFTLLLNYVGILVCLLGTSVLILVNIIQFLFINSVRHIDSDDDFTLIWSTSGRREFRKESYPGLTRTQKKCYRLSFSLSYLLFLVCIVIIISLIVRK